MRMCSGVSKVFDPSYLDFRLNLLIQIIFGIILQKTVDEAPKKDSKDLMVTAYRSVRLETLEVESKVLRTGGPILIKLHYTYAQRHGSQVHLKFMACCPGTVGVLPQSNLIS